MSVLATQQQSFNALLKELQVVLTSAITSYSSSSPTDAATEIVKLRTVLINLLRTVKTGSRGRQQR